MTSIADQLQQLLQQRAQQAPTIASDYSSALSTAADQDQQSIDQLRGIYSDPSKFERSPISALGLGLMKGTKSGRFNESMYNGLAAHSAAVDYNQEQNLSREEKLAKLAAIEATLTRQKAQDQLGVYDTTGKVITNMQGDQQTMADLDLQRNPIGSRPLAIGEEGPVAPDQDPFRRAQMVYNDYHSNPQKYSGTQGQQMVKDAIEIIKNERTNATRMQIAQQRNQPRPRNLTTVDKRIIDDAKNGNVILKNGLANIEEAEKLGPNVWYGPWANERARIASWWAGKDGADDSTADEHLRYQQIMEGEAIGQMSATLKGATTDREMQKFIDIVADPSIPWTDNGKKAALLQVKRFIQSQIELNDEKIKGVSDGSYYTGEPSGNAPEVIGTDADGVDITWDDIMTTAEENNMTPEQVIERLRNGK